MKVKMVMGLMLLCLLSTATACSKAFWGGAAGGTLAAGAGYELRARQQMEKLKDDLDAGRITQDEYNIRKSQIEEGSLAY